MPPGVGLVIGRTYPYSIVLQSTIDIIRIFIIDSDVIELSQRY